MSSVPDDLLGQVESGQASPQILDFVARGLVPLPPDELVRAVASVLARGPANLTATAERSFGAFDAAALKAAVLAQGIRPEQLDAIARRTEEPEVLELLIRHRAVPDETLAWLAETVAGPLQDIIVTNQVRLLQAPVIVERLFENPRLSPEIRRRADEFLEEFFLKKEREKDEAAAAAAAAPAAVPEAAPAPAAAEEEPELSEDEKKSLFARVSVMSVVQKIRLAYRGNKEERMFLVQDRNRLVSAAALKSPKTREADAETIANMKSVSEDVLRGVAFRRDWMRHYGVLRALVRNPRSPIDVTLGLVLKLNAKDMKTLSTDRNIPEAVRATARREVARKES
ncbi:MAG TPA: hypothetical protein VMV60_09225 [Thermoanaerobaculia bacterium]|nr:hypothetical protein [Thermoanaerobaculia bacterium]